jgi:hypothetical protein
VAFTVPEMLSVADLLPVADGVKIKRIVQEPLVAMLPALAHVPPEREKSAAFVPVIVKKGVERTSEAVPVLEIVTVSAPLGEPTF